MRRAGPLWPGFYDRGNFPHRGTFAVRRTRAQFLLNKAVSRTLFAAGHPVFMGRIVIQIKEVFGPDRQGRATGMVKEEDS